MKLISLVKNGAKLLSREKIHYTCLCLCVTRVLSTIYTKKRKIDFKIQQITVELFRVYYGNQILSDWPDLCKVRHLPPQSYHRQIYLHPNYVHLCIKQHKTRKVVLKFTSKPVHSTSKGSYYKKHK